MLLSGGLDSQLAMRLILDQGIELYALHFTSLFSDPKEYDSSQNPAVRAAARLDVPITIEDMTEDLLRLVENPPHGFGSGVNPCIDCRVVQLRHARRNMDRCGGRFVVTGEVLGERPMSQRRGAMELIEREAGLQGLVVRPLSALALEATVPEKQGWVDRTKFKGITGRRRVPQMELAREFGITDYPTPAGGCRLTEPGFARRMRDLMRHGELSVDSVRLLGVGRHFRLAACAKLVVGRNEEENQRIESLALEEDLLLEARGFPGPLSLGRGAFDEGLLRLAAGITARYGQGRDEPLVIVAVSGALSQELAVAPADDRELEQWRI